MQTRSQVELPVQEGQAVAFIEAVARGAGQGGSTRQTGAAMVSAAIRTFAQIATGEDDDMHGRLAVVRDALLFQRELGVSHLQVAEQRTGGPQRSDLRRLRRARNNALHRI